MSRDSSPATLFGRLVLRGSLESTPSPEMPVTTRGMRQTHRNLAASHSASSGAVAGPSRSAASTSTTRQSGRRPARQSTRASDRRRQTARRTRPDDDDDDDEEDDSDDSDDENPEDVVYEIMSTLTDTYRNPTELRREVSPSITEGLDNTEYQT